MTAILTFLINVTHSELDNLVLRLANWSLSARHQFGRLGSMDPKRSKRGGTKSVRRFREIVDRFSINAGKPLIPSSWRTILNPAVRCRPQACADEAFVALAARGGVRAVVQGT